MVLLKQALWQRKAKALLIVLAVAMGASVLAALLSLNSDLRYRMNRELRDYGPNVILMPDVKADRTVLKSSLIPEIRKLQSTGLVVAFSPELFVPAVVGNQQTVIVGADLDALRQLYPGWKWQGGNDGAILGVRLARRLSRQPGGTVNVSIDGKPSLLAISGLVEGGEAEDDQLFLGLSAAQKISGNADHFHIVALSALGDLKTVEQSFHEFAAGQVGVSYQVLRKIAAAETLILDRISRLIALVISIIFLILFFCIQTTVSAILLSRQSEIALFRVLGARRKQITLDLTLELLTLGLIGGVTGFVIGIGMAQVLGKVLFQTYILPHAGIFLITIIFSLLMMVVSSIWPIHRAVNRQAALVLKEA